eukprot:TRINITY_DN4029_c0_g1_i2.p1 TRINITY_DN4029_c0_g1~~TRINITY_DN4029_c0_g1_i2.p1  ORF type:complete len:126 (-),score=12.83 TRINITY_DN4029_c0_g1_i2:45-422(-)
MTVCSTIMKSDQVSAKSSLSLVLYWPICLDQRKAFPATPDIFLSFPPLFPLLFGSSSSFLFFSFLSFFFLFSVSCFQKKAIIIFNPVSFPSFVISLITIQGFHEFESYLCTTIEAPMCLLLALCS